MLTFQKLASPKHFLRVFHLLRFFRPLSFCFSGQFPAPPVRSVFCPNRKLF